MKDEKDPIKHIILLILENHSFDRILGGMSEVCPGLNGVDKKNPGINFDSKGNKFIQEVTRETQMIHDPLHDHKDVMEQLSNGNSGFIKNFEKHFGNKLTAEELQAIMGYYPQDFLPATHTLARHFTVCDHWFSSLPGPTWPNRFFALSGTCMGNMQMLPTFDKEAFDNIFSAQSQDTIFDRLQSAEKSWNIYYYDFPCSLLLKNQRKRDKLKQYRKIDEFFSHCQGDEAQFPEFSFIEPKYYGLDQNDDHPPHNTMKTQKLIADVYTAIRSNDELWESSLLVIFYDEHGGFYDHVIPPGAVAPDTNTKDFAFNTLGVRVPAILVSPWVEARVEKTVFDHTSFLKYVLDKWQLPPLTERVSVANSIGVALRSSKRDDTPKFIRVPQADLIPSHIDWELSDLSKHHKAILYFLDKVLNSAEDKFGEELMAAGLEFTSNTETFWKRVFAFFGCHMLSLGHKMLEPLVISRRDRINLKSKR